jgi:lipid II:glycine glycyltransferase (peptidoglycan interpeptide bridge formation enzyme)
VSHLTATPVEINWHSGLPIYASEAFLKAVGDEYGWVGGTDDSGHLRCALPYTVIRKACFRMVRFRVETIPLEGELDVESERSFLNSAIEYFRSAGADMIIPANNTALFQTYPDGAVIAPYGTFIKDLGQTEEVLWNEIATDYRQNIRKAIKERVHVKSGMEYLDTSYNLVAHTLKRSNVKWNYSDFKSIVLALGENVRIFIAECEGVVQACMVAPFSEHSAYDWYSGTISKPVRGAMHLLTWEAIRQFHGMGVKLFNFQGVRINPEKGSRQEGIRNFKMRFGGRLVQGYMWKYSFRPLKFAAYSIAARLLLGGDIVDVERHELASE